MAQGAQELGHLPKAVVQVSSQINQHHHQTSGDEEVIQELHQPATSDHLSRDLEDEDSWLGGQSH